MELENEQGQQAEEPAPPEQKQLTIDLSDDGDDDDADQEKGKEQQQAREPGRKARRNQRFGDLKREYETRLQAVQNELAELRGRVSVPPTGTGSAPANAGADPLDTELAAIETQKSAILTAIQALPPNDPRVAELSGVWQRLQDRRDDIRDDKRQAKRKEKEPTADVDRQRAQQIQLTLEAEFPQIYASESMQLRARAEWIELRKYKPDTLATAREACQRALGRAGISTSRPGPTDLERTRHSGIPARAGAQGTGGQWVPNRFEIETARAWTKNRSELTTDEERVRAWARETGNMPRQTG